MAKAKTSITTENRSGSAADVAAKEQRTEMPLSDLHPFEGHPFKVLDAALIFWAFGRGQVHAAIKKFADLAFRIKENSKNGNSKSGNLYG